MVGQLLVTICLLIAAQSAAQTASASRTLPLNAPTTRVASTVPSVFEMLLTRYRFENDGTGRKEVIAKIRILSEMGALQQAEQVFEYHPLSEELQIPYVRVRHQDGTVVNVEANVVQPVPAGVTSDSNLDERKVRIPGLAVGDSVEYEVVTVIHRPLAPGEFCVQYSFEPSGVFNQQLEVDVPMDREVQLKSIPNVKFWTTVGARKVYHWQNQSTNALQAIEIPYIPGRTPDVQVSSFSSWEEVGRWYSDLEKNHRVPTADVKAKADELTKGLTSDLQKVEALYGFAARRIKYFSLVSFGIGGSEPHSASETLRNTYGDCKDKTALLEALLEAEGLHATTVLISGDRRLDLDMVSPWPFDHVITLLEIGKDKIWLDPSSAVLPFKMLAYPLRGKRGLVLSLEGAPHFEKTPTEAPVPNIWSEEIEGEVKDNGTLEATVKITARGDAELPLRQAFLLLAGSMRPTGVQGAVTGIDRSDKVTDVNISDPVATNEPFILSFHLAKPIFVRVWEKDSSAKLPLSGCRLDSLGGYSTRWDNGDSPNVRLGPPRECDYKISLEFAPKFKTVPPADIALQNDYASYRSHYEIRGNTVSASRNLITYMDEVPHSLTQSYQAANAQVLTDSGVAITVVNSGPASQK